MYGSMFPNPWAEHLNSNSSEDEHSYENTQKVSCPECDQVGRVKEYSSDSLPTIKCSFCNGFGVLYLMAVESLDGGTFYTYEARVDEENDIDDDPTDPDLFSTLFGF